VTTIFCVLAVPVCRACGTASTLSHSASSQGGFLPTCKKFEQYIQKRFKTA